MTSLADILGLATGPQPARPPSRGALLGMNYQNVPDMRASIDDRRGETVDLVEALKAAPGVLANDYRPSPMGGANPFGLGQLSGFDPMLYAWTSAGDAPDTPVSNYDPYGASFKPGFKPSRSPQAPYQRFETGPNLPPPPFVHLPWSPGDPGWTPPPSPSGPHNPKGDDPRPGYDRPSFPLDLLQALRAR